MDSITYFRSRKTDGAPASHIIRTGSLLLLFGICSSIFSACGPADQTPQLPSATPTALPTPTPLPPQPETALVNALQRFDDAQSFTVHTSLLYQSGTYGDTHTTDQIQYIVLSDAMSLLESNSTFLIDSSYQKFCMGDTCYKTDATGLFKPNSDTYFSPKLSLFFLDMEAEDMLTASYTYLGEELIGDVNTFKYEYVAGDEQISNSTWNLAEPRPEVYLYVNAGTGNLVRFRYSYSRWYEQAVDRYETTKDYYDWNITTLSIPQYVDSGSTEWQAYTGEYSSAASFEFPMTYILTEDFGYPSLKTPSGSQMDFTIYATIALLSDAQYSDRCPDIFNEFILSFDSTHPTLERAEWIHTDDFDFCKGVINTTSGQRVEYLFNEPMDVAGRSGRLLPETFRIIIYPAEGDDVDTIFGDVIQTIRIGGSE